MTLLHPSRTGSTVAVWFVGGEPVRLVSGTSRFRVVGRPKCADINGERYWRARVCDAEGRICVLDLRQTDDGWILAGVDHGSTPSHGS